jgi:Reverse transcriptase (RNA-dependent DNA polymerase)
VAQPSSYELLLTRITCADKVFSLGVIYRSPSLTICDFVSELTILLDELQGDDFMLCGDFNCPGVDGRSFNTSLHRLADDHNLAQHVDGPTHRLGNMLDLVFTSPGCVTVTDIEIYDAGMADHHLVSCHLAITLRKPLMEVVRKRRLGGLDIDEYAELLESRLATIEGNDMVDTYWHSLSNCIETTLDELAPVVVIKKRLPSPGYFTLSPEAVSAKEDRRRLELIYNQSRSECDRIRYRIACRRARVLINSSRNTHLTQLVDGSSCNLRQLWRTVNGLLHPATPMADMPEGWAQKLSDCFETKTVDIKSQISTSVTAQSSATDVKRVLPIHTLCEFESVTMEEVSRLLSHTQPKSSPLDVIPTWLLKLLSPVLTAPITTLANLSLSSGIFPSSFKYAQITPILKKPTLPPCQPSSYRPISNLTTISKLLEKLCLKRLLQHLPGTQNLDPRQSAYCKGRSTESSLLRVVNDINGTITNGSASLLIGLDISAAFDCIEHDILLDRLEYDFGVTGIARAWFASFLSGRTQSVITGRSCSSISQCIYGVPQGSVLGPVLFTLYTAPLARVIDEYGAEHGSYADDTNIYAAISPLQLNDCAALRAADGAKQWYTDNGLLLNTAKSEAVIIGTRCQLKKFDHPASVVVAGTSISCHESTTTLGVTIDSQLTFSARVNGIISACNYHLRAFKHIRPALDDQLATTIGRAIVLSRLDYCNSLLVGCTQSDLDRLQHVQNKVVRIIKRLSPRAHVTAARAQLHWLPIRHRINYKLATLTFTALNTGQPDYLAELLVRRTDTRTLRSSADSTRLTVPTTYCKLADRAFSVAAPTVWNSLPANIRSCSSIATFKCALKSHYFRIAYCDT